MTVRFCTLFDQRYATRGIVMLESLEQFRKPGDEVFVLALDAESRRTVQRIGGGRWRVLSIDDLQDSDLSDLKSTRPHKEFCWTCAPALSFYVTQISADDDIAIYVDSDLEFFDDPRVLLRELGDAGTILIHEHRYSPDRMAWLETAGRFNVGFVAFRVGSEAKACVACWRTQTIESCESDSSKGLLGDQGYLNEWPGLYPNLRIIKNIGGGVAPWNVDQYQLGNVANKPTVDNVPVVFYHYHSLRTVFLWPFGLIAILPAVGYQFSADTLALFYRPYLAGLRCSTAVVIRAGLAVEGDHGQSGRELLNQFAKGQILLSAGIPETAVKFLRRVVSIIFKLVSGLRHRFRATTAQ